MADFFCECGLPVRPSDIAGISNRAKRDSKAEIEALRAQLAQAQEQHAEAVGLVGQYGLVNGRLEAELEQAQATIARQREWIKSAGHRPECHARECAVCCYTQGPHEWGVIRMGHEFQPGTCGCGWAEHVEEKS